MTGAQLLALAVAYGVGSVSFAWHAARRANVDLRTVGSGNLGATNVGRALGPRIGRIVMMLDVAKGMLPTVLARGWWPDAPHVVAAVGVAVTVGHVWPFYLRFRGGKGAATGIGAIIAMVPPAGVLAALAFFAAKRGSGRASVGSLAAVLVATATVFALDAAPEVRAGVGGIAGIVALAHHENIGRLLRGTEPRA